MDIHLTEQQEILIREAIEAGRFRNADDAVTEALRLWEQREARFIEAVKRGEAELDRGESLTHKEVGARIERMFQT